MNPILKQARDVWEKLPAGRRRLIIVGAVATIGVLAFFTLRPSTERYATLFSNLGDEDAAHIVEALKAANVPFRAAPGSIEVPEARVHEQRIALAGAGLPRGGGIGFELFDKQTFGTTSFVEQMNFRRALQGELARTISAIDAVDRARVHIAIPEKTLYKDDDEIASASVALRLKAGRRLSPAQVRGIVHLVAASAPGLRPDRITIVDESGAPLWTGEDSEGQGAVGQPDLERSLARRVADIVEGVVGPGRARVVVTAEMDNTRVEKTEEVFDKDRIALRSESRTEDVAGGGQATSGGVAGARGNLPGAPSPTSGAGDSGTRRMSETRNYEVNRTVSKISGPKTRIKRLHVAVVVDQATGSDGKVIARSAEDLQHIASLARAAAGFEKERGDELEIHSARFAHEDDAPAVAAPTLWIFAKPWRLYAAAGAAAFLLLMTMVILLRRRAPRDADSTALALPALPAKLEAIEQALEPAPAPAPPPPPRVVSARDRAHDAIRGDAARAAKVLAGWLAENVGEKEKKAS